jgi:hypothetical protein
MGWSREKDYHGYKSYGEDAGGHEAGGIFGGLIGALKSVLGVIAKPTPSPVNLSRGARGYSTLGNRAGARRPDDSAFPASPASNENAQCTH